MIAVSPTSSCGSSGLQMQAGSTATRQLMQNRTNQLHEKPAALYVTIDHKFLADNLVLSARLPQIYWKQILVVLIGATWFSFKIAVLGYAIVESPVGKKIGEEGAADVKWVIIFDFL
ncbi:hypothetical protein SS50377_26066 [Spironucleus salmonicida]|uniref:Uncharacterized protein n=1 Tax=Spironucleus salmonicida TaxID=348837 RepID=A0A9P8LPK7_9EUKA|nr:hypothetical protein SS50377_26066 [Spironucleus salmonicida]